MNQENVRCAKELFNLNGFLSIFTATCCQKSWAHHGTFFGNIMMQTFNWDNQFWLLFPVALYWRKKSFWQQRLLQNPCFCYKGVSLFLAQEEKGEAPTIRYTGINLNFPKLSGRGWEKERLYRCEMSLEIFVRYFYQLCLIFRFQYYP